MQIIAFAPTKGEICKVRTDADMRATGIVRRIDELGRVVIPKEIRRTLRIREGDPLLTTGNKMDVPAIFGIFTSVIESHGVYFRK